ncbi:unnamed protein product, partial [Ectocarpus fasciculatus]
VQASGCRARVAVRGGRRDGQGTAGTPSGGALRDDRPGGPRQRLGRAGPPVQAQGRARGGHQGSAPTREEIVSRGPEEHQPPCQHGC